MRQLFPQPPSPIEIILIRIVFWVSCPVCCFGWPWGWPWGLPLRVDAMTLVLVLCLKSCLVLSCVFPYFVLSCSLLLSCLFFSCLFFFLPCLAFVLPFLPWLQFTKYLEYRLPVCTLLHYYTHLIQRFVKNAVYLQCFITPSSSCWVVHVLLRCMLVAITMTISHIRAPFLCKWDPMVRKTLNIAFLEFWHHLSYWGSTHSELL